MSSASNHTGLSRSSSPDLHSLAEATSARLLSQIRSVFVRSVFQLGTSLPPKAPLARSSSLTD
eukprot:scaffold8275_cov706-Pinguiococcus_pyrenoidosus.AAC.1